MPEKKPKEDRTETPIHTPPDKGTFPLAPEQDSSKNHPLHSYTQIYPQVRMRRLRKTDSLRSLIQETQLHVDDFIYPLFVEENLDERTEIKSMAGIFRETEETLLTAVQKAHGTGLKAVMLFGIPKQKDSTGSDSMASGGFLSRIIRHVKDACPDITLMADLCFCEYTDHGHCGVLTKSGDVDNDRTLDNLAKQAIIAAESGADLLAPSGMMDGMVATIRGALDQSGFSDLPVMAYSSKFASAFYGPFREAAGCNLGKGNRKTYQMNPANRREAIRESLIDENEGADILMIKPGMPYLDILADLRKSTMLPIAVYQVSGEYAMIKHAAQAGILDEELAIMETLISFKRAGADLILSYFAPDAVRILQN